MPPLARPVEEVTLALPARSARLAAEVDVLVVGGGPAGIGAAWGAARAGARTVLVERYGFLGGNATAAPVMPLMSFHTENHRRSSPVVTTLFPTDHGPGSPVIAGALEVLVRRLVLAGGAIAPSLDTGFVVPFDPEIFKLTAMEMLDEAGVQFLFHAFASDVIVRPGRIGAVLETKSGPIVVSARQVVDCTGDGDVAVRAGASFDVGREEDGLVQPMTLMFRIADFDRAAFARYVQEHPSQWRGVHGLWDLVRQAAAAGKLDLPREDILFFGTPHPREVSVNSTRVRQVFGIDVWDLSYAEWAGRRQMREVANFLREYVPGFAESYVFQSGVNIGVRETRRIHGDYTLTGDDIMQARRFDDAIARGSYPIDIHNPKGKGTVLRHLPPGEAYDIPMRCLLPREVDRVLVAGRCISGTHEAHSSYRVMPISMATGQAAGAAAALASRHDTPARALDIGELRRELVSQGANLG